MVEIDIGYYIERWICIPVFSILFFLYIIQASTERNSPKPESKWTIKWTAHRLGPLASLLMVASTVDASEVFGIWTKTNRGDYFTSYNCTSALVALCMSALYSIMNANYVIVRERLPACYSYIFMFNSVLTIITGNGVTIFALLAADSVPRYIFLFQVAAVFIPSLVLFEMNAGPLIQKLESFKKQALTKKNPRIDTDHAERAVVSLKRLRVLTLIAVTLATVGEVGAGIIALRTPLQPKPNQYEWSGNIFIVVQALALMIILYFVWVPVGCDCANGRWFYEVKRRVSSVASPVVGSPTNARQGGGGKPAVKLLPQADELEMSDARLAKAHFIAGGGPASAGSSSTNTTAGTHTQPSHTQSTQHTGGAAYAPRDTTSGQRPAPTAPGLTRATSESEAPLPDAHWRVGSVVDPRPQSVSTASSNISTNFSNLTAPTLGHNVLTGGVRESFDSSGQFDDQRGFQQDMEEP